ncbi:MAG TPA: 50S ribosomal protein L18e [Candidatus Nanoarchaeia archaeon]|nr:50S ribosomal protein L18e [Candidatus Nanoarchaeia archaeon]
MPTGPSNPHTQMLIVSLRQVARKLKVPLWHRVADELSRPTRQRCEVNLFKIDQCAKDGEFVIVPGKVLGDGVLTKKVKLAAFKFSQSAKDKVKHGMSLEQALKENPKGDKVRLLA